MLKIKLLALTLLTALCATKSMAQIVGVKGGLNVSNFYVDDVDDKNARYGFNAGLFSQWPMGDAMGLQAELLYSTKGNKSTFNELTIDQETKINLNYLDVPVMAVFKLGDAAEIHAGVYGSYLLSSDVSSEGDAGDYADDIDKENFKSFDWGFLGGLGVNFGALQVGARYNLGMAKIADSDEAKEYFGDAKNSVAQLYAAFRFGAE